MVSDFVLFVCEWGQKYLTETRHREEVVNPVNVDTESEVKDERDSDL